MPRHAAKSLAQNKRKEKENKRKKEIEIVVHQGFCFMPFEVAIYEQNSECCMQRQRS